MLPTQENIEASGLPPAFCVAKGDRRAAVLGTADARDVLIVEARMLAGHQKEAVVQEGEGGSRWRMVSDEGRHLKGTDLAPFPLGFFNAGLSGDLLGRIASLASRRGVRLDDLRLQVRNFYWMTGSFIRGDGQAFAEPAEIRLAASTDSSPNEVRRLLQDAVAASPAFAAMRAPLVNTFALTINGRRRAVTTMPRSPALDPPDPFVTYSAPPAPEAGHTADPHLIRKTGEVEPGDVQPAPAGTGSRIVRTVSGLSRFVDPVGVTDTETWLEMAGASHFVLRSDERAGGDAAPSGLALLSAGVAFCFMTQLSRYIEHMKLDISGVRLVQSCPFTLRRDGDRPAGGAEPVHTHLFLNGRADEETHERLMQIAARTCYLHATLAAALPPDIAVEGGGEPADAARRKAAS
jgi:uncharacterized OsmC-like protein